MHCGFDDDAKATTMLLPEAKNSKKTKFVSFFSWFQFKYAGQVLANKYFSMFNAVNRYMFP